ncbi:RAD9, HUS1, RAD1-interacting nuclear orphan protein 1 [Syngnathoides biaculeatus]|uniref:RAD9, HUS1, RAD1-interacting nuclear orphan protein 1 n=1 Tax=Syngnathoides biaculeatus TaxID=300417 RepID=UPI002ADE4EB0|nr:RAD9, HUS1, RAD1-interacting nuclear orphan protein 1 [Syngnathoides biaculeatus]
MPRKSSKTRMPPLLFVERPACGKRLQPAPEVRAALHPKEFFSDTSKRSDLASWVNPQFDTSLEAPAPQAIRSRRRKCSSFNSTRGTCSRLPRKPVCEFPPLLCLSNGDPRPPQAETSTASCLTAPAGRPSKSAACQGAPKRRVREKQNDGASTWTSSSRLPETKKATPQAETSTASCSTAPAGRPSNSVTCQGAPRRRVREKQNDGASTWTSSSRLPDTEKATPNVDSPTEIVETGSTSSPSPHRLLAPPRTPPQRRPPAVLVPDTPERDYGLKVTWRRRPQLMAMLEERGRLAPCHKLVAGLH